MKFQVTLLLICTLFSKAMSLTCLRELPGGIHTTVLSGSDQCITMTFSVFTSAWFFEQIFPNFQRSKDGENLQHIKDWTVQERCINGSVNVGALKVTLHGECCSTDLCNNETLPALPKQTPNGRMCYTCDVNSCSRTMKCEGNEDHCITASDKERNNTLPIKGCATKSICYLATPFSQDFLGIKITDAQCCEDNLCNGDNNGDNNGDDNGDDNGDGNFWCIA